MLKNSSLKLHIPQPLTRPGDEPDLSYMELQAAGEARRPDVDENQNRTRDLPFGLVRVLDGQIAVRRVMNVSSSFDHRIVDGYDAACFIGVQATGAHFSELVSSFTQAIEMQASLEDIGSIIHAHPTLGEAFHDASLKGLGHAIHI